MGQNTQVTMSVPLSIVQPSLLMDTMDIKSIHPSKPIVHALSALCLLFEWNLCSGYQNIEIVRPPAKQFFKRIIIMHSKVICPSIKLSGYQNSLRKGYYKSIRPFSALRGDVTQHLTLKLFIEPSNCC